MQHICPLLGVPLPGPVTTVVTPYSSPSAKARVHGIDRVDGPQMGHAGVGVLAAVVPLDPHAVLPHAQMAVGVNQAGHYPAALPVQVPRGDRRALIHPPGTENLAPLDLYKAILQNLPGGDHYPAVVKNHAVFLL